MNWFKLSGILRVLYVIVGMALVAFCFRRRDHDTKLITGRLEAARIGLSPARCNVRELVSLPAPVQRYFSKVLKDDQPIIAAAALEQVGTFNMSETAEQRKPFIAKQRVITQRPGFDWDARIQMLSGVAGHILDAYIAGHGMLRGAVWGQIPVVNMPNNSELQQGEFMRHVMKALWYPTALLPSQGVQWEAIDNPSGRARLSDRASGWHADTARRRSSTGDA